MDPSGSRPPPSQPPQQTLASQLSAMIRPEQVKRLPQLHEADKRKHEVIVSQLWNTIHSNPQNSPEWAKGFKSLREMSGILMQGMKNFQNQKQTQDQAQQQVQHQRIIQQQQQQQAQMAQQMGLPNDAEASRQAKLGVNQIPPHIQQKVNQWTFSLPPQMAEGSPQAEQWLREARNRLAQATQRHELANARRTEYQRGIQAKAQSGNPYSAQELDMINAKILQCNKAIQDSASFMEKFKNQQNSFREAVRQSLEAQQQEATATQMENTTQPEPAERPQQPQQPQPNQHPSGIKPLSITSAVSAAREQAMNPAPIKQEDGASPTTNQPQSAANLGQATQQTQANPQSAMVTTQNNNGANVNFASQSAGLQLPPSSTHAHPSATFMTNKEKDPRNSKNFNVTAPRPVQMPPARPTLNGGPGVGMAGQLGEPAIPSMPGYVLEDSEDGRVLSKEKLRELAREVLGPGDASYMSPEAEEILLDTCDEFVDDLIEMSCKLCKLRGGSVLDIRDFQYVLERHFNIRVPGYSADEVRTVRRPGGTVNWQQKITAVQAAKLTGGGNEGGASDGAAAAGTTGGVGGPGGPAAGPAANASATPGPSNKPA